MYNHARTLLINRDGDTSNGIQYVGDELIPSSYRKIEVPGYLATVLSRVYGISPDHVMKNYRTAQLLNVIASTELQQYLDALDSRTTYKYPSEDFLDSDIFSPQIKKTAGDASTDLSISGTPISSDVSGIMQYDYAISVNSGTVEVQRLVSPTVDLSYTLAMNNGLSQSIPLDYSGYSFRVNTTGPASWRISGLIKPSRTLAEVEEELKTVGEPSLLQLFGSSPVEPYKTFKACWGTHPEFAYRLGGIIVAVIYRLNEVYNAS